MLQTSPCPPSVPAVETDRWRPAWVQDATATGLLEVSVCIVNWNCRELLRACLESLHGQPQGVRLETIVVDNASGDGAADMVARDFPEVHLVRNRNNLGFARANNQAAQLARGRYLFFLNNDTVTPAGALRRLFDFAESHPEVGLIGPRLRDGQGDVQISCRPQPTLIGLLHRTSLLRWTQLLRRRYIHYRRAAFDAETTRRVDIVMGAAMFVPRTLFEQVGGWDEGFTFGGEDLDLSTRIGQQREVVFLPRVEIRHFGRVSTRLHSRYAATHIPAGFVRYLRKCGWSWPMLLLYKLLFTLDAPVQMAEKLLQWAWRRLRGRREEAEKSLLVASGLGSFLRYGLSSFWLA